MGATYLSMQIRTTDREAVAAALEAIASADAESGLRFYVAESIGGWLAVFPNFTLALERSAKAISARLKCLVVLLLSADEDELYCMFFREGRQLPWFKIGAPWKRRGKEREKLGAKLEALADACDADSRARLLEILADSTGVIFSSELMRALCETVGIHNAFTSFEYLQRGSREGLETPGELWLVPGEASTEAD